MAQASEKTTGPGNTVPHQGDHDRVQMLSVRADGTPDQHNPEFIGDRDATVAVTTEQFRQQAVSAVDVTERGVSAGTGGEPVEQDPTVAALQEKHQSAADAAAGAAESAVSALLPDAGSDAPVKVTSPPKASGTPKS